MPARLIVSLPTHPAAHVTLKVEYTKCLYLPKTS